MAKKEIIYLSKSAYARSIGVSEKAVRKAIDEGKIKKGWDAEKQKVIKHLADKEYGHLHEVAKPRPGISQDKLAAKIESEKKGVIRTIKPDKSVLKKTDVQSPNKSESSEENEQLKTVDFEEDTTLVYAEIIRRKALIELALEKKKLEEAEDILVRKEDVEKVLFSYGNQLKKSLLSVPARVIDDMLSAANKIESLNILTEALVECLEVYANIDSLRLNK